MHCRLPPTLWRICLVFHDKCAAASTVPMTNSSLPQVTSGKIEPRYQELVLVLEPVASEPHMPQAVYTGRGTKDGQLPVGADPT